MSIFWELGICANVVSAWLGSIYDAIKLILEAADLELLAKIFAVRNSSLRDFGLAFEEVVPASC